MKKVKYVLGILILIILIGGAIFKLGIIKHKANSWTISDEIPNINSEKDEILKSKKWMFYSYEEKNQKYFVFKIYEETYTDSIEIKSIKLKDYYYEGDKLNIKVDVDFEEGKANPYRDWPLMDQKYIVMKVNKNTEKLCVNGVDYEYIY